MRSVLATIAVVASHYIVLNAFSVALVLRGGAPNLSRRPVTGYLQLRLSLAISASDAQRETMESLRPHPSVSASAFGVALC